MKKNKTGKYFKYAIGEIILVCGLMKIKKYDTPIACKENYYFCEKKGLLLFC
jgi:hypothetical protein